MPSIAVIASMEEARSEHLANLAGHVHDYLHVVGAASMARLLREAERWTPGDSRIPWESLVADVVTWASQRGDLRRTAQGVRILPGWALGPFEHEDRRLGRVWAARLHGAFPAEIFSDGVIRNDTTVVDGSGIGVGRVTLALSRRREALNESLVSAQVTARQWPASAQLLLDRRSDPLPHARANDTSALQFLQLGRKFGQYKWSESFPGLEGTTRGVARIPRTDQFSDARYFITEQASPMWEISGDEVPIQVWRQHLARMRAQDKAITTSDVVSFSGFGLEFPGRVVPAHLMRCLHAFDTGASVQRFQHRFLIPSAKIWPSIHLVEELLERISNA